MRVFEVGEGDPKLAIIGGIHGDEPCGVDTVERLMDEDLDWQKGVKLIIANERAVEQGVRYTDADLNRSWPGNPESDVYEERLAAELMKELDGLRGLAIHSTRSTDKPFGLFDRTMDTRDMVEKLNVRNVVELSSVEGPHTGLTMNHPSIEIEVGPQGSGNAGREAYRITVEWLQNMGALPGKVEVPEKDYFEMTSPVEGSGWEFTAENFKTVEKGEVFARRGDEEKRADEEFVPILMSTDGYKDQIGMKGRKI